jgi:hypothetical protein
LSGEISASINPVATSTETLRISSGWTTRTGSGVCCNLIRNKNGIHSSDCRRLKQPKKAGPLFGF